MIQFHGKVFFKLKFLFACSAGDFPEIGTGHFVRMFALAQQIQKRNITIAGVEIDFAGILEINQVTKIQEAGFVFHPTKNWKFSVEELAETVALDAYDVVVIDNLDVELGSFQKTSAPNTVFFTIDNLLPVAELGINLFSTRNPSGLWNSTNLIALPQSQGNSLPFSLTKKEVRIFCSFGGYDHRGISLALLRELIENNHFTNMTWIIMASDSESFLNTFSNIPSHVHLITKTENFLEILDSCDIALVSGGLTMFQSLHLGKPTIVIPQYEHQVNNSITIEKLGGCLVVGKPSETISLTEIVSKINALLESPPQLKQIQALARTIVCENGLSRLAEIVEIVEFLEWDSKFFGFPIARVNTPQLNQQIVNLVFKKAEQQKVKCLYYLDSGESFESLDIARKNGFVIVDSRVTLEKKVLDEPKPPINFFGNFRLAIAEDVEELSNIASDSYVMSRYYFDSNFDETSCRRFYSEWVEKSVLGKLDDLVIVCEANEKLAGFITLRLDRNLASIGLIGVRPNFRSLGIGRQLLNRVDLAVFRENIPLVRVVTQGRNLSALRLYIKSGYQPTRSEYWHHCWNPGNR